MQKLQVEYCRRLALGELYTEPRMVSAEVSYCSIMNKIECLNFYNKHFISLMIVLIQMCLVAMAVVSCLERPSLPLNGPPANLTEAFFEKLDFVKQTSISRA